MLNITSASSFYIIHNNKLFSWDELRLELDSLSQSLGRFSRLNERSWQTNHADTLVAIISQDRFFIVLLLLHAFFKKCCCYPLPLSRSIEYINTLLNQQDIDLLITDEKLQTLLNNTRVGDLLGEMKHRVSTDTALSEYLVNTNELASITKCALLITTSGSISLPKVVPLSFSNIVHHVKSFTQAIPLTPQDLWLNCLPLEHIAGVMVLYRCLLARAGMLLDNNFDEKRVWRELQAHPVSHISLVPLMLKKLLDYTHDASPPGSLKYALIGGDAVSETLYQRAKRSGWPVYLSYGMTEACSTIAIGRERVKLQLLDGISQQINQKGELLIKGPMLMSGYTMQARDKTAELKNNWFNTHDLVSCTGRFIRFQGRTDSRIISGGMTLAPQLIEELLMANPGVKDVAVGKVSHPEWGHSIVALVKGNIEQLKFWGDKHLDKPYRPRFYIAVANIPRNHSGKISRAEVQQIIERTLHH